VCSSPPCGLLWCWRNEYCWWRHGYRTRVALHDFKTLTNRDKDILPWSSPTTAASRPDPQSAGIQPAGIQSAR
ncbi:unnamed protein product, partial [Choristocarpus tenellus]